MSVRNRPRVPGRVKQESSSWFSSGSAAASGGQLLRRLRREVARVRVEVEVLAVGRREEPHERGRRAAEHVLVHDREPAAEDLQLAARRGSGRRRARGCPRSTGTGRSAPMVAAGGGTMRQPIAVCGSRQRSTIASQATRTVFAAR